MTDLEIIEQALKATQKRCEQANPYHMNVPASGASVIEWLIQAIDEAKKDRLGQASELMKKQEEMEAAMKEYEIAVKARKE